MYEAFYGLTSKPFQLNPDPSFFFGSKQHRRAKAYLDYGVSRNEGFIVITGEIGAEDTLRMVGASFGFKVKDVPKSELLITLEAFLISQTSKGKRCLLIVDEAQNLTPRAVEELRMLSNFQFGNQALMQSFLVGQPEFREILQRPEMEQFRQRVAATCHIGPMDQEETRQYIEHRLKCAGSTGNPSFDPAVFEVIHRSTGGIPRRINSMCDRLLLAGFLAGKTHLGMEEVNEVVREFAEEAKASSRAVVAVADSDAGALTGPGTDGAASVPGALDVDLTQLQLDASTASAMSRQLRRLAAEQRGDQVQRLERAMLRLERTNLQLLTLVQQLVNAVRKPGDEGRSEEHTSELQSPLNLV